MPVMVSIAQTKNIRPTTLNDIGEKDNSLNDCEESS
jgi:hypothetical protein